MSEDNGIMQGMKEAGIFAMFKDVSIDRIIELASAEREGRVIILGKAFKEPNGMFTTLVYNKSGLLMGRTDETAEESERNAAALAREPKGEATT